MNASGSMLLTVAVDAEVIQFHFKCTGGETAAPPAPAPPPAPAAPAPTASPTATATPTATAKAQSRP